MIKKLDPWGVMPVCAIILTLVLAFMLVNLSNTFQDFATNRSTVTNSLSTTAQVVVDGQNQQLCIARVQSGWEVAIGDIVADAVKPPAEQAAPEVQEEMYKRLADANDKMRKIDDICKVPTK